MSLSAFTPRSLTEAVYMLGDARQNLLMNTLFIKRNTHPTKTIDFGVLAGNMKVAGYTRPGEQAKPVDKLSGDLKTLVAPEMRLKKTLDESFYTTLNPGLQGYYGPYTNPHEQVAEKIAEEQKDLRRKIDRQNEITAAMALRTGTATLTYKDGTTVAITYEYVSGTDADATIQPTLTGTAKWDSASSNPLKDVRRMIRQILSYSNWGGPSKVFLGSNACDLFMKNKEVKEAMHNRRFEVGHLALVEQAQFRAQIGAITFFEYVITYDASDGTKTDGWNENTIAVVPDGSNLFTVEHGAIFDRPTPEAEHPMLIQTELFSTLVKHKDPAVTDLIVQSNPIPVMKNPRTIRILKVA